MILVVGGAAAGKHAFVREVLNLPEAEIAWDVQELVRDESIETLLPSLLEKQAVVCNEVGSGIVPLDARDRAWRESVGRLCCALAKEATAVVRLCCGIPTVIKGSL